MNDTAPPKLGQLGHLIEGVIEQDPMTDRYVIRTEDAQGTPVTRDVQDLLAQYVGKEVRFTLVSFENLAALARLVEEQGGGLVSGVQPNEVGVPWRRD
jgi:hypothetical protein